MHSRDFVKPDGRYLILYGREPIEVRGPIPSPFTEPLVAEPHLRWHPLRGEWIAYASHRQNRTFLPPPEYNPLGPTLDPSDPTELPDGHYDVAVFANRFPALTADSAHAPTVGVPSRPARGACEVVVFTRDPQQSLGRLPVDEIAGILEVLGERTHELGTRPDVAYVMPFENRGAEIGATIHHPHGQIYAYPIVPPIPANELANQRYYFERVGRGLLEDFIASDTADGERTLYASDAAVAFVPSCARYTYEAWIAPRKAAAYLHSLDPTIRRECARALKTTLLAYDGLWNRPMPYLLIFHQAPTDGLSHPEAHVHIEIYPAYRTRDRLKYLAGTEMGAGFFTSDSLPEAKAAELRAVEVALE
ncbi:MAG: galactose-1-phosphate uridylyltransferase [Chloroflexota bacterium]|nr:MAG: galactose-1-phosphate uridylyltransferase [Chloroflexota bacterium]